jgi:hypothetical protein
MRGKARKDLIPRCRRRLGDFIGNLTLNLRDLTPTPSVGEGSLVLRISRQPEGHRRRGGPRLPPAEGTPLENASLNCSRMRGRDGSRTGPVHAQRRQTVQTTMSSPIIGSLVSCVRSSSTTLLEFCPDFNRHWKNAFHRQLCTTIFTSDRHKAISNKRT